MKWEITSFTSLGPIRLGMGCSEVGILLDAMHRVIAYNKEYDGSEREFRDVSLPIVSYVESRVSGVDTNHRVKNVFFKGCNIYQEKPQDVLRFLERENGGALIASGMVLFAKIGISTAGFYFGDEGRFFDENVHDQDDRGLGIFLDGAFDSYMTMFEPIYFDK